MMVDSSVKEHFRSSQVNGVIRLEGLPTELTIELTSRCQLACKTCPRQNIYKGLVANMEMQWDLFERLARSYVPSLDYLSLAGGLGEPLLYSRFPEAVRLARSLNPDMVLSISTNALLPATVELLAPLAPLFTFVQISMDSIGDAFDRVVGRKGAFPIFERTVRQLIPIFSEAKVDLRFNAVVTPETIGGLDEIVRSVAEWRGQYLFLNGFNLVSTNREVSEYEFYLTREYKDQMEKLVVLGKALGVTVGWHDMRSLKGFSSCYAPWNNFYIGCDGVLAPCCAKPFPELLSFGHVEDGGLAERINDPGLVEFRRLSLLNRCPPFCSSCAITYGACTGSKEGT